MAKYLIRVLFVMIMVVAMIGCGTAKKSEKNEASLSSPQMENSGEPVDRSFGDPSDETMDRSESYGVSMDAEDLAEAMAERELVEQVDNFMVILDVSGSNYMPDRHYMDGVQQTKLKRLLSIIRRFNQKTPERPLTGGLRTYGPWAGAFTQKSYLLYPVSEYDRADYDETLNAIRWSGGRTRLTYVMDQITEDMRPMDGLMSVVIISDGRVRGDGPVAAATRMKNVYGDRLCIYVVLIGDPPADGHDPESLFEERETLERIVQEAGCGFMVTADSLESDQAMADFADEVFNRRKRPLVARKEPATEIIDFSKYIVRFDLDKYNIKPEYFDDLEELASILRRYPDLRVEVQGHTCIIASEQYNKVLSHNRAISVSDFLLLKGVSPNQLAVKGFSYHRPAASNKTQEGRMLNRRVEFMEID